MTHRSFTVNHETLPRIAIVGGGFAGVAVALRLFRRTPFPLHIQVLDTAATPGLGVAYGTELEHHLLNGVSKAISLFEEEPRHFTDWLERQAQAGAWVPPDGVEFADSLPPRRLYGTYVQDTWRTALAQSRPGVRLEHYRARVTALEAKKAHFVLTLSDGGRLVADKVVLATGLMRRRTDRLPFPVSQSALASARYIGDQWASGVWDGVERESRIIYLGSGLSALDGLISSEHAGFRGRHVALSRKGLPVNERRALEPWPDFLHIPESGLTARQLIQQIRPQLREIAAQDEEWQRIVPTIRLQVDSLWSRASGAERQRFLRHLRSLWDVSLHRSAPTALSWQTRVKAEGRYCHAAGHVTGIDTTQNGLLAVRWRPRGTDLVQTMEADRVVNCLGFEYDWTKSNDPLCQDVLARGLVLPDALGFGLQATPTDCTLLNAAGLPQHGLHAVGHPLRGVFWESNAVTEHIPQATKVAQSLIAQLTNGTRGLENREMVGAVISFNVPA